MKNKIIIKIINQRFIETLVWCILISAVISFLCVSGAMPVASLQRDVALCICPIVFIAINVKKMRNCYYEIKNTALYYTVNLCAYAIFAVLNLSSYVLFSREAYTWCFLITGFARFSSLEIATKISIAMFHCINFASIFLAPIGMGWVLKKEAEKRQYIENMPPMLKINPTEQDSDNTEVSANENKE